MRSLAGTSQRLHMPDHTTRSVAAGPAHRPDQYIRTA